MLARRSFLRALGLAPAALASQSTPAALGLKGAMGVLHEYSPPEAQVSDLSPIKHSGQSLQVAYEAWKALTGQKVPEHKREQIIRQARYVTALDPDLVANRSYSLVTKMRLQGERNVQRRLAEVEEELEHRFKREAFQTAFNFDVY